MDLSYIVTIVALLVGCAIVGFGAMAYKRLRGGVLSWAALFITLTGIVYVLHVSVEVFGLGFELYAVTSLIVTIFLAFTFVILDITLDLLGVKK